MPPPNASGRPATTSGTPTKAIDPDQSSTSLEVSAGVREYVAGLRRRRAASLRLPPLECGHADPLDCVADRPVRELGTCLCSASLGVADRERAARLGIWCSAER